VARVTVFSQDRADVSIKLRMKWLGFVAGPAEEGANEDDTNY
jgi:hypothetical protein